MSNRPVLNSCWTLLAGNFLAYVSFKYTYDTTSILSTCVDEQAFSPSWYSRESSDQWCLWLVTFIHEQKDHIFTPPTTPIMSPLDFFYLHSIQTHKNLHISTRNSLQSFFIKHTFYPFHQSVLRKSPYWSPSELSATFKLSSYKTTVYHVSPPQSFSIKESSSSSPAKMPSFTSQHVQFNPDLAYCRPARDDEAYVMKAWTRHTSHCRQCARPYELYKLGGTLCPKGQQRARAVADYLYNKEGEAYSLVDQERRQSTRVEIPAGCEPVRDLLKALERGFLQQSQTPVESYDRIYYVAPRRRRTEPRTEEPGQPRKPSHLGIVDPTPRFYPTEILRKKPVGRGSLYEEDMRERESRQESLRPIYYTATPKKKPIVSAKYISRHWMPPEPSFLRVFPKISSKQASHGPIIKIPPAWSINLNLITIYHHHPLARKDIRLRMYILHMWKRPPGRSSSVPQKAGNLEDFPILFIGVCATVGAH